MNENKSSKIFFIIIGIGFAAAIIGMFVMVCGSPDVGAWIVFIGLGGAMLCIFWLAIKSFLVIKKPGKTGLVYLGITVAILAVIGIGFALDLGTVGTVILTVVVFLIGLFIKGAIDSTACPKCGKKFSMKEISHKTVATYATTKNVEQKIKNTKGKVIGTYTQRVPATRYVYECIVKCKFCGHCQNVRREETYKD